MKIAETETYITAEVTASFRSKLDKVRVTVRCKKKKRRVIVAGERNREVMEYIDEIPHRQ